MDQIVKKLYDNTDSEETLFLITGDHGMDSNGVHGGSKASEIYTFTMVLFPEQRSELGAEKPFFQDMKMVDVSATISSLLGIPVPDRSIGEVFTADPEVLIKSISRLVCKLNYPPEKISMVQEKMAKNPDSVNILSEQQTELVEELAGLNKTG